MPLFKPSESDQPIRSLDLTLIDIKRKLSKDDYIKFLEKELAMTNEALHKSVVFASALEVAKAEKIKKS